MRINNTQYVTQTKRILEWFTGANPFIWVSRGMYLALGNMVNHKFYEIAAADYVRLKLADTYLSPSPSKFDNKSVEGTIRNSEPLYFQSAKTNWGSIKTWAIMDARGVVWWSGEFTNAFTVSANQTVVIPVGQIKFMLESALDDSICIHVHSTEVAISVTCPNSTYIFGSGTDWYITIYDLGTYNITITTTNQTRVIPLIISEIRDYDVTVDWSKLPLGGRIFYDDGDNNISYKFYDIAGQELTYDGTIASLATATHYTYSGIKTKDRFYIYDNTNGFIGNLQWGKRYTYVGLSNSTIGYGKSNTNTAITTITDWEANSIWPKIQALNNTTIGGCNDWYIMTMGEQEKLRLSGLVDYYTTTTDGNVVWASSEYNDDMADFWYHGHWWHEAAGYSKAYCASVTGIVAGRSI